MNNKVCAKVDRESIHVDPELLFQRLITAARDVTERGDSQLVPMSARLMSTRTHVSSYHQ